MTKDKYKHYLFTIISIWLVLTQTLPPFNMLFPLRDALKYVFFIGFTIILFPTIVTRRSIIALFVYIIILLLFFLSGNAFYDDVNGVLIEPFTMMVGLLLIEYALKYDSNYRFTLTMVFTFILANVVMSIISIPMLQAQPNLIRMSGRSDEFEIYSNLFIWVVQYQTVHGLPFLFAPLVFLCRRCFKNNKKLFVFWISVTAILGYLVFRSNAATSFILSAIMVLIGFIFNMENFSGKVVIRLTLIGILGFILMQPSVIDPILSYAQSQMDSGGMGYKRMGELRESVVYSDASGDLEARQELYSKSSTLFWESPLWGTSKPEQIGRHSWIMDRLALLGILFSIPLFYVFKFFCASVYRSLHHTKVIFVCGFVSMLLLLSIKNSFGQGSWLYGFAFLPLLCRYIDFVVDNKMSKPL